MTFRDTAKKFGMNGDLLKIITNKNHNLDLANLTDKDLVFELAKEMYFEKKSFGYYRY